MPNQTEKYEFLSWKIWLVRLKQNIEKWIKPVIDMTQTFAGCHRKAMALLINLWYYYLAKFREGIPGKYHFMGSIHNLFVCI